MAVILLQWRVAEELGVCMAGVGVAEPTGAARGGTKAGTLTAVGPQAATTTQEAATCTTKAEPGEEVQAVATQWVLGGQVRPTMAT